MKDYAAESLKRDEKVQGANWNKTYNGYFSDEKVFKAFEKVVKRYINRLPHHVSILYACSSNGELGERVASLIRKTGRTTSLTLVEASAKHLAQNSNFTTEKIHGDLLDLNLNQTFDLVIMRSALDYFPSQKEQIAALKVLQRHMHSQSVFINQAASMPTIHERNTADEIYASNEKIGRRHFQCVLDIGEVYSKAGFEKPTLIENAPNLVITDKEHTERYGIDKKDIEKIQKIIKKSKSKALKITKTGYSLRFEFPILISKLK